MNTKVTKHIKTRMKQRAGTGKSQAEKMINRAIIYGLRHNMVKGPLKKWMDAEFFKYGRANNCRYYARKLYILHNNEAITVLDSKKEIDDNLRQNIISDKDYIDYQRHRLSRHRNPDEAINILLKELNEFIPPAIIHYVAEKSYPITVEEVSIKSDFIVYVFYSSVKPRSKEVEADIRGYIFNSFGLNTSIKLLTKVKLPDFNRNNRMILHYLVDSLHIDSDILIPLFVRKDIYQSESEQIVFVGSNEYHIPRQASVYSMAENGLTYCKEAPKSDSNYAFNISVSSSKVVHILSSELEVLSYMTIRNKKGITEDTNYLVIKEKQINVINEYLSNNPHIEEICLCGNNEVFDAEFENKISMLFEDIRVSRCIPISKSYHNELEALF